MDSGGKALNSFYYNTPSCLFSFAFIHPFIPSLIHSGIQQMIVLCHYSVASTVRYSYSRE